MGLRRAATAACNSLSLSGGSSEEKIQDIVPPVHLWSPLIHDVPEEQA